MNVYVWDGVFLFDAGFNVTGTIVAFAPTLERARELARQQWTTCGVLNEKPDHVRPCDAGQGEAVFGSGGGPY